MITYRVCNLGLTPPTGWKRILTHVFGVFLPKNDPDFFFNEKPVAYWWLELEGLEARREIGFGRDNVSVRPELETWYKKLGCSQPHAQSDDVHQR